MKLLGLDFETDGPDSKICTPIEFGCQLYESETGKRGTPWDVLLCDPDQPQHSDEIVELTGITNEMLDTDGVTQEFFMSAVVGLVDQADVLVAYNAPFDRTILYRIYQSFGKRLPDKPWMCMMADFPWPANMQKCRKLSHRALDLGLPMDTRAKHRAMADVTTMFDVLDLYDVSDVLAYVNEPWVYFYADVAYEDRELAKAAGFGWQMAPGDDRLFPKKWIRRFKAFEEMGDFPFKVKAIL